MYIQRKDRQCEARVIGISNGRVLIEARWPKNRNTVYVSETYFAEKYGQTARSALNAA